MNLSTSLLFPGLPIISGVSAVCGLPAHAQTRHPRHLADAGAGFPDDFTATTVFREGPVDTGVYKLSIPIPPGGERYFVRIEY